MKGVPPVYQRDQMNKVTVISILLFVFILSGCNGISSKNTNKDGGLSGKTPPNANIKIDDKRYDTELGSYCWKTRCVDKEGPVELLKGKKPIQVQAGENITLGMQFTPKPNEVHLSQISNGKKTDVEVKDNQFAAPRETGTYYYDYEIRWMDEKEKDLSHGDASYAFVLEVK